MTDFGVRGDTTTDSEDIGMSGNMLTDFRVIEQHIECEEGEVIRWLTSNGNTCDGSHTYTFIPHTCTIYLVFFSFRYYMFVVGWG